MCLYRVLRTLGPNIPAFSPSAQSFLRGGRLQNVARLVVEPVGNVSPPLRTSNVSADLALEFVYHRQDLVPSFGGVRLPALLRLGKCPVCGRPASGRRGVK